MLRATAVLDLLVSEPRGLTLTAVARRGGLDKATALRLLRSLAQARLVVRDEAGLYRPGMKLVWMAQQILQSLDFRKIARPHVEALARATGHRVLTGVLEGSDVVYVDQAQGEAGVYVDLQVGGRLAAPLSSIGRAIVAHLPPAQAEVVLETCQFQRRTPQTIVDPEVFRACLSEVRRQGWALVRDESTLGVTSFAAPVFGHDSQVLGAVGVTGPSFMLEGAVLDGYVRLLLDACRAASTDLGHRADDPAAVLEGSGRQ